MSTTINADLGCATIAAWYTRLAENPSPRNTHWQTKVIYYRAVAELLDATPGSPLSWRAIVDAARPRGSRSTFYEVAGQRARHGMVSALIDEGTLRSYEIALRYRRPDPIEQLIDETKVWSFWPDRQGYAERPTEARLVGALAGWAGTHPRLAAANAYRPPACAVEDLTLLNRGRLAATRAESILTELLRGAAR
ncbi:hypothetical protein [Actinoplanes sp. NPDC049265]|uniref:hypothetical protein n=1 Tax=Actinoplanes sp. NPDC049265 TaxID=3363902 RepID=UPI0037177322